MNVLEDPKVQSDIRAIQKVCEAHTGGTCGAPHVALRELANLCKRLVPKEDVTVVEIKKRDDVNVDDATNAALKAALIIQTMNKEFPDITILPNHAYRLNRLIQEALLSWGK